MPVTGRRLAAFMGGVFSLWVAMGSPLAALDHELLTFHMVQHLLLMTVAAPLLLAGVPVTKRIAVHPVFCWLACTFVVIGWHVPALFALGMHSVVWHEVEQASFLAAGLLFWLPVLRPGPSVPLYLFLATLPCDALSAFLTFCDRVVYPSYMSAHRIFGLSALQDQQWAGTLMWVWVTFAYLAPAASITMRLLSPRLDVTVWRSGRAQEAGLFDLR